jgi:translation initiation factor IF-3
LLRRNNRLPQKEEDKTRINEDIRSPEIRVISADGEQLGILTVREALKHSEAAGLDLVEVSPNAKPPVCRIMDYGKYKFEVQKKAKQAKAKQHVIKVKEIKFHPKTDSNDYAYRLTHAMDFLEKGYKVKVTVVFRGREMAHKEYGKRLLDQMNIDLEDYADKELDAKMEGNNMTSIYIPAKKSNKKKNLQQPEAGDSTVPAPSSNGENNA